MKRSLLTEGKGIPLSVAVEGANRHDMKMVRRTLAGIMTKKRVAVQHLCLDKGYDFEEVREILEEFHYTAHIRARGEEWEMKKHLPGYRNRRWVVERSHSWMNRYRRILIRWEKLLRTYLAMLHLACAAITYQRAGVLG